MLRLCLQHQCAGAVAEENACAAIFPIQNPREGLCSDHEGARDGRVQQWDGKGWKVISDWYTANQSDTEPLVEEVSAKYAADKKIQPRDCSKES